MPMDLSIHYLSAQSPVTTKEIAGMQDVLYCEAVGSLMYLALATRPDIAFTIAVLSHFGANPRSACWNTVKRVFKYLKGTVDLWLTYGVFEGGDKLCGYTDADGNMVEDCHTVSGYTFMINGRVVSWSSKKQDIVLLSMTESKYVAATHSVKEALWMKNFISQLFSPLTKPIDVFCDNQSTIALMQDYQYHVRTKHIDIHYHFIQWVVKCSDIQLIFCPTVDMLADVLTKALPSPKVKHFALFLGLCMA